jgi:glycogen phosphorylase
MSTDPTQSRIDPAVRLLHQLALDLRWSWNHASDDLWRQLDPQLWARTHNPWVILRTTSRRRLLEILADPAFGSTLERLTAAAHEAATALTWFQQTHSDCGLSRVAYFSMEFMVSEALPIYAGGLGNVAGDQLKAASDLGVPVVGVGLLYSQGYFRQVITHDGTQQALYPYNDPGQLPITPLRNADGEWIRLEIGMPGHRLWLRTWHAKIGRVSLYLLDSNDIANYPAHRGITSELYGGGAELRLQQEIVLGIGGWRLLDALNLKPDVCHLNEGHAALVVFERARAYMTVHGVSFATALIATRAGNLFTTHTAVAAGFDQFEPALMAKYFARYAADELHITMSDLLALGRQNAHDDREPFNMAYLAARGSGAVNGVSRLHGEVSRRLFQPLFPRWPPLEVPMGHVTNGVHTPSWDSPAADELWTGSCGKDRWRGSLEAVGEALRRTPDPAIWRCRAMARNSLVEYARERLSTQLAVSGASAEDVQRAKNLFNPHALTLGFARRFATYKRPNLLLQQPERLARLLRNPQRPVQLILAGKAHPADIAGQGLIREWIAFVRRADVRAHAIFLSDYDMLLTKRLVEGVDLWINTPRRPWEACGTSGMKVLVNGGLNLSVLDGWWAEAYDPRLGWALGDGQEQAEDPARDAIEADQLYQLLEDQVIPQFYSRDENDIPRAWVTRVRESMACLTPKYSANRSVREYVERFYIPAARAYQERSQNRGAMAEQMSAWRHAIETGWPSLRFGEMAIDTQSGWHHFSVPVALGELPPAAVSVELYADSVSGRSPFRLEMTQLPRRAANGADPMAVYVASVPAMRDAADYTARIVSRFAGAHVPLEAPEILWQR